MTSDLEIGLYIFLLAGFLGYHIITRVPPLLHTPLMSATNAISGISLIGSLVVTGADYSPLSTILGTIAIACSSTNVVGGFLITAVPQRTALSHSLGALAATLIGISEYIRHGSALGGVKMTAIGFEVVIGALTFTGSLMAAAKLQELLRGAPITYRGQNRSNMALLLTLGGLLATLIAVPSANALFFVMVGLALLFGF